VRTGDTLGAIAIKTGVSVTNLEDLNPGLDPEGLVAGQKLKLRE
jgi:LysM repeat protein